MKEKYKIKKAFVFIGYLKNNQEFYKSLEKFGYELIFKEVIFIKGKPKANVDGEMIAKTLIEYPNYDKALLVTNDGDFAYLVRYLKQTNKLLTIISPDRKNCSILLRKAFNRSMPTLFHVRSLLSYQKEAA